MIPKVNGTEVVSGRDPTVNPAAVRASGLAMVEVLRTYRELYDETHTHPTPAQEAALIWRVREILRKVEGV